MLLGLGDDGFRTGFSTASQFQYLFLSIFCSEVLDHVNLSEAFSVVVLFHCVLCYLASEWE